MHPAGMACFIGLGIPSLDELQAFYGNVSEGMCCLVVC